MARKPYDGSINRHTADFSKAGPKGEPASGLAIQRYIKEIDSTKFGAGMTTPDGGEHLFFVDEEDMQAYIEDPTRDDLILDRIQLEVQYTMAASLLSEPFSAVKLGSVGNYIEYTFETVNKNGQVVSEPVTATYTISRGSTTKVITETYIAGTVARFGVDSHLLEGTNNISIRVKGNITNVSTIFGVSYQVINLDLNDTFDISPVNEITDGGESIAVRYAITGTGTKTMEWYLDGEMLPYNASEDEILETSIERTKYIQIDSLTQGVHSIQYRAKILVAGEAFYSDILYREFIVSRGDTTAAPVVAVASTIPSSAGIVPAGSGIVLYPIQYVPFVMKLAAWNPDGTHSNTVTVSVDGNVMASAECTRGNETTVSFILPTNGSKTCTLSVGSTSRNIDFNVEETSINVKEIDGNLMLSFQADGRNNSAANKDSWTDGTHTATFSGFDWTETSGWVDGNLLIPSDASLGFNFAPLSNNPTANGRTVEVEFDTVNVEDDNATLIDLMSIDNGNPVGIKLTATEISVRSRNGSNVSRRFKTDERLRISVVINAKAGSKNKLLLFVYINGIISMVDSFDGGDSFQSNANLVVGGHDAGILLKQIKVYDTALSSDQILNNWILYRDTIEEMTSIYDKNDLYETGTQNFDLNKIAKYLPVMVLTGDMTPINNAKDNKATTWMDVEYTNLQNPEYSFKMVHAQIRPQGTSSLTYPRKNLRLYTDKSDETIVYDSEGKVVPDKLYAFKPKAQRVWCWTLKADFAESSSTHNTGVARIWNDVLKTAKVNDEYVFRTLAQQAAADNNYPYDVRTTVDGFPIVIFWHETEDQPLTFLGKYNFNNDKSTESVFGFKDIPGFNDSSVQCWEFRDSGYDLALFKTPVNDADGYTTYEEKFDAYSRDYSNLFQQVWESRYPDTKTPDYTALRRVALWLNSTENNLQEWIDNKAYYFDLYKLAAYYVYLMRFGAVDQTVKNAMMTTEDGLHWFFINYDNDTILGVRNDGLLRFGPEIDRQSPDPELGGYAYAGHNSVLWNNFEADPACMELVKVVDSALFSAGLTYNNMIKMFNEEQAGKWSEKVYNDDAQYKYLDPYIYNNQPYLGSLQGSRSDHRKWWISNRFSNMDAKYGNAAYTSNTVSLLIPNAPIGSTFSITAGKDFYYGYGQNRIPVEIGVRVEKDVKHTFTTNMNFEIGTPLQIYAPQYIKELDLSGLIEYVGAQNFSMNNAYSETLGSKMKRLILGVDNPAVDLRRNNALSDISSISDIVTLEYLNVAGYQALRTLDLSSLVNLKTLKAKASGLTSVTFAPGSPVSSIELPSTIQSLTLRDLMKLHTEGIILEGDGESISNITVRNCPNISNSPDLLLYWLENKTANDEDCEVYMDNIAWENIDTEDILKIAQLVEAAGSSKIQLFGHASMIEIGSVETANALISAFGPNVFKQGSAFHIDAASTIFLSGPTEVLEGDNAQYNAIIIGAESGGELYYEIISGKTAREELNRETGVLSTTETGSNDTTLIIRTVYISGSSVSHDTTTVVVKKRTYPTSSQISILGDGDLKISSPNTYTISYLVSNITGRMDVSWELTGDLAADASIVSSNDTTCVVQLNNEPNVDVKSGFLSLTLTKVVDSSVICTVNKEIGYMNDTIAVSRLTNPYAMEVLYNNGLCASPDYMTKVEAALVTSQQIESGSYSIFYNNNNFRNKCTSFNEFQWFTGLSYLPMSCFNSCKFTEIKLPIIRNGVAILKNTAFGYCGNLTSIDIPSGWDFDRSASQAVFTNCTNLSYVKLGKDVIGWTGGSYSPFVGCKNLTTIDLSDNNHLYEENDSIYDANDEVILTFNRCTNLVFKKGIASTDSFIQKDNRIEELGRITSVTLSEGVTQMHLEYLGVTSIYIPSTVKLTQNGIVNFPNLTTITYANNMNTYNGEFYCAQNCPLLDNVSIPYGFTTISGQAFSGLPSLSNLSIPNTITRIERAFGNSPKLELRLPSNVTRIYGLNGLKTLDFGMCEADIVTNDFYYAKNLLVDSSNSTFKLFDHNLCHRKSSNSPYYEVISIEDGYPVTTDSSVTGISCELFYPHNEMESITIPSNIEYIDYSCIANLSNLKHLEINHPIKLNNNNICNLLNMEDNIIDIKILSASYYCFRTLDIEELKITQMSQTSNYMFDNYAFEDMGERFRKLTLVGNSQTVVNKVISGGLTRKSNQDVTLDITNCPLSNNINNWYSYGSRCKISTFIIRDLIPPTVSSPQNMFGAGKTEKIYVPYGCGNTYKTASGWSGYASYIFELNQDGSIPE